MLVPVRHPSLGLAMELLVGWPIIHNMNRKLHSSKAQVASESAPMPLPVSLGTVGSLIGLLVFWFAH
jgi:hypothetical protein